ncbi:MAG TPA: lysyl oxidase family protein [Gaiellales bacterium]|nr:lysyl oxidase family protein [Gaiellales bacterium]
MARIRTLFTAVALIASGLASAAAPAAAGPAGSPHLRLIAAAGTVDLQKYRRYPVQLDLGVYLASFGGDFQLDVARAGYRSPIRVIQVVGSRRTLLPDWVATGWQGVRGLVRYTVRDAEGNVVAERAPTVCPNAWDRQRVDASGPLQSRFPQFCGTNVFTLGSVWGIDKGWSIGLDSAAPSIRLPVGTYSVTLRIERRYARLFGVPAADATAKVTVHVFRGTCCGAARAHRRRAPQGSPTIVPTDRHPAAATMPDLIPLPAWSIGLSHHGAREYLDFAATVWDAGPAPMDVEGFRRPGTNIMDAYQYFFRDGKPVGRTRAGTLEYDARRGHEHWHFLQFARYSLLGRDRSEIVRSQKQGYCLAPTDPIDLTVPDALWDPYSIGLQGACGGATSIWTRETLPAGWGDTYFQSLPGQSFDITDLPNGRYDIEVQANPLDVIHEVRRGNDITYRRIILGGTPGARTVRVPAWNGLDPES